MTLNHMFMKPVNLGFHVSITRWNYFFFFFKQIQYLFQIQVAEYKINIQKSVTFYKLVINYLKRKLWI